jgi:hypothetical protein
VVGCEAAAEDTVLPDAGDEGAEAEMAEPPPASTYRTGASDGACWTTMRRVTLRITTTGRSFVSSAA